MNSNILMRRLTAANALSARVCQPRPVASWVNFPTVSQNTYKPRITLPSILSRSFSQTPQASSSPFRLSSNNTTTSHDEHPELSPSGEPLEYYSPYKPKRQWPPDMRKLSPKHQFRLERKYRRRAALKYARPRWTKATKLAQWGAIGFILIYAVLFMEWDERGSPFDEIRKTFFSGVKTTFSTPPPPTPIKRSENGANEQ